MGSSLLLALFVSAALLGLATALCDQCEFTSTSSLVQSSCTTGNNHLLRCGQDAIINGTTSFDNIICVDGEWFGTTCAGMAASLGASVSVSCPFTCDKTCSSSPSSDPSESSVTSCFDGKELQECVEGDLSIETGTGSVSFSKAVCLGDDRWIGFSCDGTAQIIPGTLKAACPGVTVSTTVPPPTCPSALLGEWAPQCSLDWKPYGYSCEDPLTSTVSFFSCSAGALVAVRFGAMRTKVNSIECDGTTGWMYDVPGAGRLNQSSFDTWVRQQTGATGDLFFSCLQPLPTIPTGVCRDLTASKWPVAECNAEWATKQPGNTCADPLIIGATTFSCPNGYYVTVYYGSAIDIPTRLTTLTCDTTNEWTYAVYGSSTPKTEVQYLQYIGVTSGTSVLKYSCEIPPI